MDSANHQTSGSDPGGGEAALCIKVIIIDYNLLLKTDRFNTLIVKKYIHDLQSADSIQQPYVFLTLISSHYQQQQQ